MPLDTSPRHRRSKISRVCQYSRSEGIRFDIVRSIRMSSQGWRQFSGVTPWAHPAPAQSAPYRAVGDWRGKLQEGPCFYCSLPPTPPNTPLCLLVLQPVPKRLGHITQNSCVWAGLFWSSISKVTDLALWRQLCGLRWAEQWYKPSKCCWASFIVNIFTTFFLLCNRI